MSSAAIITHPCYSVRKTSLNLRHPLTWGPQSITGYKTGSPGFPKPKSYQPSSDLTCLCVYTCTYMLMDLDAQSPLLTLLCSRLWLLKHIEKVTTHKEVSRILAYQTPSQPWHARERLCQSQQKGVGSKHGTGLPGPDMHLAGRRRVEQLPSCFGQNWDWRQLHRAPRRGPSHQTGQPLLFVGPVNEGLGESKRGCQCSSLGWGCGIVWTAAEKAGQCVCWWHESPHLHLQDDQPTSEARNAVRWEICDPHEFVYGKAY